MSRLITRILFNDQSRWFDIAQLSDFRAAQLARQLGLSRRQVERYVRRHFNLTPQEWLRNLRMARAGELIQAMHSVKEVAYALKFAHVSTFCRQFKSHYGVTCTEFVIALADAQSPGQPPAHAAVATFVRDGTESSNPAALRQAVG